MSRLGASQAQPAPRHGGDRMLWLLLMLVLADSGLNPSDCCRGNGQLKAAQHKRSEAHRGSNVSLEMLDILQRKYQQVYHMAMA